MEYILFCEEEGHDYHVALLTDVLNQDALYREYVKDHWEDDAILAVGLYKDPKKKRTSAADMDEFIQNDLDDFLQAVGTEYLLVADAEYFKRITGHKKADTLVGYVVPSKDGKYHVSYVPNIRNMYSQPHVTKEKIARSTEAMQAHMSGEYKSPEITVDEKYLLYTDSQIQDRLNKLSKVSPLGIDIETFSLKFNEAGLRSISFSPSKDEGWSFIIDDGPDQPNLKRRAMLKDFFLNYKGRSIYHGISFDATVLIYQLFMDDILDLEGLYEGMDAILHNYDCTYIISYLALNSCARPDLSLKTLAQPFAGDYAEDNIKDIMSISVKDTLVYNIIDTRSTMYVYDKYMPKMIRDEQGEIYTQLFQPALKDIVQMQLTGLPVNMDRVVEVKGQLESLSQTYLQRIFKLKIVKDFEKILCEEWIVKKNSELKTKSVGMEDAVGRKETAFTPTSSVKLGRLLYEVLELPVLKRTAAGNPSVDAETLGELLNHATDSSTKILLQNLADFFKINTVLTTFIPALERSIEGPDGWHYMCGNFRLGGTVSGRLSSNNPNLQNLPSSGDLGALIKSCIQAPNGYLFTGLDFDSLEDKISALTTKDPNKLIVYEKGMDGHSFRAYSYWPEKFPDIDPNSVESINSIKTKYPTIRDASKEPTFLMTYWGKIFGLISKCGFSEDEATRIYNNYHELYKVSVEYIKERVYKGAEDGYITVAFGLRVRTPVLAQSILGNSKTPYEAEQEFRTAANAMGQSWCLLNSRASMAFMRKLRRSEFKYKIRPCAQIHDAMYFLIEEDIETLKYLNDHLVEETYWNDHPDIYHDVVQLGGSLSLFFPSWNEEITLPQKASTDELLETIWSA